MPKTKWEDLSPSEYQAFKQAVIEEMARGQAAAPQRADPATASPLSVDLTEFVDLDSAREYMQNEMAATLNRQLELIKRDQKTQFAKFMSEANRERRIVEFSSAVTEGTGEFKFALPVKAAAVETFAKSLNAAQLEQFMALVGTIARSGVVDFSVTGTNGHGAMKRELPAHIAADLKSGKLKLEMLDDPLFESEFDAPLSEYDFSAFEKQGA